jgi:hypothetical protein
MRAARLTCMRSVDGSASRNRKTQIGRSLAAMATTTSTTTPDLIKSKSSTKWQVFALECQWKRTITLSLHFDAHCGKS